MYPHERSLVRKLADKPFAIIGVNSDSDLDEIRETTKEKNITWRSFWNGEDGTRGPISTEWKVRGWPTTYLIDKDGVIRYKNVRGKSLDEAIENLMAEMGHEVSLVGVDHEAEDKEAMEAKKKAAKEKKADKKETEADADSEEDANSGEESGKDDSVSENSDGKETKSDEQSSGKDASAAESKDADDSAK